MSNAARIAFLCHPYHRGGVTRWMADAALALADLGHDVYFITVAPVKEFYAAKGRETLIALMGKTTNRVKIISEPAGYEFEFGTPEYRAWTYKKLISKLPLGTPVILSDDHAVWAAATCLHNSYRIVGVLHADEDHYYDLAEKYYRKVDLFTCVSQRVKNTVKKRIPGFDADRIYTIPCGINLPPILNAQRDETTLKLAFVGRISQYQKRAGDLVKIAAALSEKHLKFELNIIGDGNLKPTLETQVAAAGLQQQVKFPGWLSQQAVSKYLSETDILLLTSDFEGTPIAMMEAFAAGCGMVGTRVSGIEDYEHQALAKDCLGVYPTGAIEAAVSSIQKIAAIPANDRHLAARKLAETEFSMEVCLKRYLSAMDTMKAKVAIVTSFTFPSRQKTYSKMLSLARAFKVKFLMR